MKPTLEGLRTEYRSLFESCQVRPERRDEVRRRARALVRHRPRTSAVAEAVGVPWVFVAALHSLESDLLFDRHLHNGDPLAARTVRVPAGHPHSGEPPFTWEASATDALRLKGLGPATDWSLPGILFQLERYNGFGYRLRHPEVRSPYLWSFSMHYERGKYAADGRWSPTLVSRQCGAAVLLRQLAEWGEADLGLTAPSQPKAGENSRLGRA